MSVRAKEAESSAACRLMLVVEGGGPNWALVSPTDWVVLQALALRARPTANGHVGAAGVRTLGCTLGLSKNTVAAAIRRLVGAGLVDRLAPDQASGHRSAYRVSLPAGMALVCAGRAADALPTCRHSPTCPNTRDVGPVPDTEMAPDVPGTGTVNTEPRSGTTSRVHPRTAAGVVPTGDTAADTSPPVLDVRITDQGRLFEFPAPAAATPIEHAQPEVPPRR
ncbi:MAG TPA: hypothetical protein VFH70_02450 [Acidimicrobiales bacterium]|nr:hypothetical protein [Acidimicrobiales bacterium]